MFGWLRIQNWNWPKYQMVFTTPTALCPQYWPLPQCFVLSLHAPSKNKKKPVLPLLAALLIQWPLPRALTTTVVCWCRCCTSAFHLLPCGSSALTFLIPCLAQRSEIQSSLAALPSPLLFFLLDGAPFSSSLQPANPSLLSHSRWLFFFFTPGGPLFLLFIVASFLVVGAPFSSPLWPAPLVILPHQTGQRWRRSLCGGHRAHDQISISSFCRSKQESNWTAS